MLKKTCSGDLSDTVKEVFVHCRSQVIDWSIKMKQDSLLTILMKEGTFNSIQFLLEELGHNPNFILMDKSSSGPPLPFTGIFEAIKLDIER